MYSSVSRRKYKTRVRFDFLAYNLIPVNVFLRRMLISNVHKSIIVMNSLDARFSKNVFEAVHKKLAARVLSGQKPLGYASERF